MSGPKKNAWRGKTPKLTREQMKQTLLKLKNLIIWLDDNKRTFGIILTTIVTLIGAEVITEKPLVSSAVQSVTEVLSLGV